MEKVQRGSLSKRKEIPTIIRFKLPNSCVPLPSFGIKMTTGKPSQCVPKPEPMRQGKKRKKRTKKKKERKKKKGTKEENGPGGLSKSMTPQKGHRCWRCAEYLRNIMHGGGELHHTYTPTITREVAVKRTNL